jgi:hypothetical protein
MVIFNKLTAVTSTDKLLLLYVPKPLLLLLFFLLIKDHSGIILG